MDWVNQSVKINNKFKFQLFGKTVTNLEKFYSNSIIYDPQGTGLMNQHAFNLYLNASGIFLSTQEIRTIKEHFAVDEKINYIEFVDGVRRDISGKRLAAIDHAFI
jgi:hypothetical protein